MNTVVSGKSCRTDAKKKTEECVGVPSCVLPLLQLSTATACASTPTYLSHHRLGSVCCDPCRRQAWVNSLEQTDDAEIGATVQVETALLNSTQFVHKQATDTLQSFLKTNPLGMKKASDVDQYTLNELINSSIPTDRARAVKAARHVL